MTLANMAAAVGKGLFAGVAGTGAMTISSTVEMKLRGREASSAPVDAATKVLGVQPTGEDEKARLASIVHWGYGTAWGGVRGLVEVIGLRGLPAASAHLGMLWGTELIMLPKLEVVPPVKEWGARELAIDALHHGVYAAATSLTFAFLTRRSVR